MLTSWKKQEEAAVSKEPEPEPKLSKAERRAKHAEQQRKLWDAAYVQSLK